jgi:thiol:disulfide interchange protein DsbD
MPCVLPVISLKIMDIVRHSGDDRKELVRLGMFFTLGILISFVVLAGLAAFMGYNFGALFQKRIFLIIMIAVVFALTLSLFEVFTINIPSFAIRATESFGRRATDMQPHLHLKVKDDRSNPYIDAFGKGVLTTLLATPCSGPFLGGTLAWAFTQTPAVIFIIFLSIGIGMAFPYIILTIDPDLMRFIPKSGNWMITFERVMAFFLLATMIYLVGILESGYVVPTLWFLLFVAIAFWQYGRFGAIIMAKKKRIISRVMLVLLIFGGYFLSYNLFYNDDNDMGIITGREFDMDVLHDNNNRDIITIVDFTADWCPNCKLVERTSLRTADVYKAIKEKNIQLYIADLTRENPSAEKLLNSLGSRSIPFLAIFPRGKSFNTPICLRDIYSEKDVLNAIKMAE